MESITNRGYRREAFDASANGDGSHRSLLPVSGICDANGAHERSRTLSKLSDANPKQLLAAVKPSVSSKTKNNLLLDSLLSDVDDVNVFSLVFPA